MPFAIISKRRPRSGRFRDLAAAGGSRCRHSFLRMPALRGVV